MTSPTYTRQQARAEKRAIFKALRALRKENEMLTRKPGGAAKVTK